MTRLPSLYISHGGGPCFFMQWDPPDAWDGLRAALEAIGPSLPRRPSAILVITAHWETPVFSVTSGPRPELIYDYYGFPAHTYELTYPAPGDPGLAARIGELLGSSGIAHRSEPGYGWDHGVFIPLKVMYPDADIPVVAMSVKADFDPAAHLAAGQALQALRDEGVLIVGSGSSFHNFAYFGKPVGDRFDGWLQSVAALSGRERWEALSAWTQAPEARIAHGREEHLLPLMVAAGAGGEGPARSIFNGRLMGNMMSCLAFD